MVNNSKIRAFCNLVTSSGLIGEEIEILASGRVKLNHPFRIFAREDGTVVVGAVFIKEESCIIDPNSFIEISVNSGLEELYISYESDIFGSIVKPPEKKIILN